MNKRYEVQEFTLCDGWVNTWTDENENPSYFATEQEALDELEAFLMDMHDAYTMGHMEDVPYKDDYRIVEVQP